MTDLTSFFRTDLVDDHVANDVNELIAAALRAEFANTETITATKELSDNDCQFQIITASGANRTVELAPESSGNHITIIQNAGTSNNVPVKDDSGATTFYTLYPGEWAMFIPVLGLTWRVFAPGLPKGFLHGLTLSNNGADATNDIDITVGKCRSVDDETDMVLATALTKRLDAAWAVGTNQGGLDTGSIANTTYHIWLIKRSDTGVVDALFSTSASSPTMPTNYNYKRRIGSIIRSGATILGFVQDGDDFLLKAPVQDVNATNPGTSAVTRTLTVPVGIRVKAYLTINTDGLTTADDPGAVLISDLSVTDTAPATSQSNMFHYITLAAETSVGGSAQVWTNTSAQVRSRIQISATNTKLYISTFGWLDPRGRV